jgi:hypothetical protein
MGEGEHSFEVTVGNRAASPDRWVARPYPDFSMDATLVAPARQLPEHASRIGDVRTRDRRVTPPTYEQLLCGWTLHADDVDSRELCRASGHNVVDAMLEDLRREAESVQADLVHDVRCFGRNEGSYLRVWCEGVAFLTQDAARTCRT